MSTVPIGFNLSKMIAVLKLLSSNPDGEVLAAAALNRMLTTASTSWDEVIPAPLSSTAGDDHELLQRAQSRGRPRLNPWEAAISALHIGTDLFRLLPLRKTERVTSPKFNSSSGLRRKMDVSCPGGYVHI